LFGAYPILQKILNRELTQRSELVFPDDDRSHVDHGIFEEVWVLLKLVGVKPRLEK